MNILSQSFNYWKCSNIKGQNMFLHLIIQSSKINITNHCCISTLLTIISLCIQRLKNTIFFHLISILIVKYYT